MTTTTTDSDGQFAFASADGRPNFLAPGILRGHRKPDGYQSAIWGPFTVSADSDRTAADNALRNPTFQPQAYGGFSGTSPPRPYWAPRAGHRRDHPLSCAPVARSACVLGPHPGPVTTNDNGKFTFVGGPKGTAFFLSAAEWEVTVSAAGYAPFALDDTDHPYQVINAGNNTPDTPLCAHPARVAGRHDH